jgi:hypothetical protein
MSGPDVRKNIAAGDLGTAKTRLASYLTSHGYDPHLCGRIGDICRDMRDPVEAGRWYLVSDYADDQIEKEVHAFVLRHGHRIEQMMTALPSACRLDDIDSYPDVPRDRLTRLRANESIAKAAARKAHRAKMRQSNANDEPHTAWVVAVLLTVLIVLGVGMVTVARVIFNVIW